MSSPPSSYDVIVVGAGISGLTAAYNIKKRDPSASILVLEANDRVGGRTHTVPLVAASGSDKWDVGGQWVGGCQVHVMKLLKELNIDTFPQYTEGRSLQQIGGKAVKSYKGTIPALSLFALIDLQVSMWKMDYLAKQINVLDPWSHPKAEDWDAMSAASYLDRTLYSNDARETLDAALRTVYGCEPNQVSFLYWLMYIQEAGGINKLIEDTENTAQEARLKPGAQQISLELSSRIGKGNVKLNEPVVSIAQNETGVTVETKSGFKVSASRVVLAMPPKAIETIEFTPGLPRDRVDFMKRMPMGNYIKVIITYQEAFWRSDGYNGMLVSSGFPLKDGEDELDAPISVMYDGTSANGNPALLGFLSGQMAVDWAKRSAKERQNGVLEHVSQFLGKKVFSFLDYMERDWNSYPYAHGGPVSFVGVGGMKNFSRTIRRVEGRIHFAGTETATVWTGYMSGAIEAGERTALEVLSHIKPNVLSGEDVQLLEVQKKAIENAVSSKKKSRGSKGYFRAVFCVSVGVAVVSFAVYAVSTYLDLEIQKLIVLP